MPTIRQLAAAPALYALMSINEYFTHKYYQHAEFNTSPWFQWLARTFVYGPLGKTVPKTRGGGHVEHHAETLDDMTLKTDAKWRSTKVAKSLDDDLYRRHGLHVDGDGHHDLPDALDDDPDFLVDGL